MSASYWAAKRTSRPRSRENPGQLLDGRQSSFALPPHWSILFHSPRNSPIRYLNGNPVSNHGRFSTVSSESDGTVEFIIEDTKSSDLGLVTCELSNFTGKASSSAKLTLLGWMMFYFL